MSQNKKNKSLGFLRRNDKTKEKSPDATGTIAIQRHLLEELLSQMDKANADEITANLAAWSYNNENDQFLSVELSPKYVSKKTAKTFPKRNPFAVISQKGNKLPYC